jgi:hypothetical protein
MVLYCTPFSPEKNLRDAYDEYAQLVKDDDWICFIDRDTMFLTADYANIIEENIRLKPDTGLFTCMTNRVGNLSQCHNENVSEIRDPVHHYKIAMDRAQLKRHKLVYTGNPISGLVMVIQKKTWDLIRKKLRDGLLGVDTDMSNALVALGKRVAIMQGLYVYHYYRLHTSIHDKSHLSLQA